MNFRVVFMGHLSLFWTMLEYVFSDHELNDLFIDTWEAAIVYVRERVQCIGKFQVLGAYNCFFFIDID